MFTKTFCICRAGGTYARSDIFTERLEVPVTYKNSHTYFSVAILYQALRKGTYLKVLRHGGVDNVRAFLKG